MNVVGLKGFGFWYGGLSRYFDDGWFPYSVDWRQSHIERLMRTYRERYGLSEYLLIGFSDGGTLAYELAAADPWCAGVIVHSGMWRGPKEPIWKPMLLLTTAGDRTPTYEETWNAYHYYDDLGCEIDMAELVALKYRPNHQFANALGVIYDWTATRFEFELPVKKDWLDYGTNNTSVVFA